MVASEFISELRQRYGIEFNDLTIWTKHSLTPRTLMNIVN